MTASENAFALIKRFEGLRLESYRDCVGVWTIGYGCTRGAEPGQSITEAQADSMLRQQVRHVEEILSQAITAEVTQAQFDACVSFAYNCGPGNFTRSTLLKKINAGDAAGAAEEFLRWTRAGGKELAGLVSRRRAERELFLSA